MENEIKVNEYVRLKTGEIFKVDENCATYLNYDPNERKRVKHSSNLIDLIQCGDYVNGYKVINILYKNEKELPTIIKCLSEHCFKEDEIKEVVTKEMMESISYKVKE